MVERVGPTAQLCRWVAAIGFQDLPEEVRREAVTLLYDQVGCMVASATLPSCQPVVDLVQQVGGTGDCSIVGHPLRTSLLYAALANGTIGHGDEVDSTGQHGTGHYAASAVPAVLSVGQALGSPGNEVVRALVLGSEVAARLQTIIFKYAARDIFYASITGALGCAVNAGVLLGLDADQLENALGLAASGASGLTSHHTEENHQTKSLQRGRAAEVGVMSALLASRGVLGPREILTAENGFFDAFLGIREVGAEAVDGLGDCYLMRDLAYKRYAVGAPNQAPVYALLEAMRRNELTADEISEIEVSLSWGAYETVTTNRHPSVDMESILAVTAVHGELTFSHIHRPEFRQDPRVSAFLDRARILIIPRPGHSTRGNRLDIGLTVRATGGQGNHPGASLPAHGLWRNPAEVPGPGRPQAGWSLRPGVGTSNCWRWRRPRVLLPWYPRWKYPIDRLDSSAGRRGASCLRDRNVRGKASGAGLSPAPVSRRQLPAG